LTIARGITGALRVMHAAGVIHRDVKSPNVLIKADGLGRTPLLCDLGASRVLHTVTTAVSGAAGALSTAAGAGFVGTAPWAAPETMDPDLPGGSGTAADIYSLGVVIWEAFGGDTPWAGLKDLQILKKVVIEGARLQVHPAAGPALKALLAACWAADYASRPTAAAVLDALDAVAKELEMSSPAIALVPPTTSSACAAAVVQAAQGPVKTAPPPRTQPASSPPSLAVGGPTMAAHVPPKARALPPPVSTTPPAPAVGTTVAWTKAQTPARQSGLPPNMHPGPSYVAQGGPLQRAAGSGAPASGNVDSYAAAYTRDHGTRGSGRASAASVSVDWGGRSSAPPSPNVFLGGVDMYVTPRDIFKALMPFGRVIAVSAPPRNLEKRFAHAQFASTAAAVAATAQGRLAVAHTTARVEFARTHRVYGGSSGDPHAAGTSGVRNGGSSSVHRAPLEGTRVTSLSVKPAVTGAARRGLFTPPSPRPLAALPRFSVDTDQLFAGRTAAAATFAIVAPRDQFVYTLGTMPMNTSIFRGAGLAVHPDTGNVFVGTCLMENCVRRSSSKRVGALVEASLEGKVHVVHSFECESCVRAFDSSGGSSGSELHSDEGGLVDVTLDPTGCKAVGILHSYASSSPSLKRGGSGELHRTVAVVSFDLRPPASIPAPIVIAAKTTADAGSPTSTAAPVSSQSVPLALVHDELDQRVGALAAVTVDPRSARWYIVIAESEPLPPPPAKVDRSMSTKQRFALIAPQPVRLYRISVRTFAPDGQRDARSVPLVLGAVDATTAWAAGGSSVVSFALDNDEAGDEDDGSDATLLAAVDDCGRLFVGKQGGDRVLAFDAATGASLHILDAPRLHAIAAMLAGHVALAADGAVFVLNRALNVAVEIGDELLENVTRMSYDAARGRLVCLTYDSAAAAAGNETDYDAVAINIASPARLQTLLPKETVSGFVFEYEARLERAAAEAAAAEAARRAHGGGHSQKVKNMK
jgi:hypothetical protein